MHNHFAAFSCALASVFAWGQPTAVEVEFPGEGGLTLRGALLLPDGADEAKFPGVLLLPGSGPTNRDGNQPPMLMTNLLKQIADRLAEEGVATLRFDKRATPGYAASWPRDLEAINAFFAWEKFVGDAKGALTYLANRPEVDAQRLAIAGHSEGGLIALQIGHDLAGTEHAPAGVMLLATAGRTLDVVLREQIAASVERTTLDEEGKRSYMRQLESAMDAVKAGQPLPQDLPMGLRALFNPTAISLLKSYFTIEPADLAAKVIGPVLILQGDADAQISVERDMPRLDGALRKRDSGGVTTVIITGASHNLKDTTDNPNGFTGPVSPAALDAIADWARVTLTRETLVQP